MKTLCIRLGILVVIVFFGKVTIDKTHENQSYGAAIQTVKPQKAYLELSPKPTVDISPTAILELTPTHVPSSPIENNDQNEVVSAEPTLIQQKQHVQSEPHPVDKRTSSDLLIEHINEIRESQSLKPYTITDLTCEIASKRVTEVSVNLSHAQLFSYSKQYGIVLGENIAVGYTSPDEVIDAWMRSDVHAGNVLSKVWYHACSAHAKEYIVTVFSTE